ncbi:eukaryotic translation initiation factor 4E transporter [Drosophila eugracilis]|uniref:eukaryotic translation initiation factor 4E transporter n=1 Tax=Drosophila eugracilis TaxID=29029 RepID=UPI0007E61A0D|nr:eukaryotic translation initiation factor 4E transporter [Drosophila eugracilis]
MDTTPHNARYSRADLLALRYESKSRQRPPCTNRTELQTLSFWKRDLNAVSLSVTNNYLNQNKNRLSPETDNSSLNCSSSGSISSRRAMRNRERANSYYQRFAPSDSLQLCGEDKEKDASTHGQSFKSSILDHRSISSSHLMPAFAKKRFVAATGSNSAENNEAAVSICDDGIGASQRKESKGKASISPTRKSNEQDNSETRLNYVQSDHEQCLSSSPTLSASRQERRIGSGRLLPRSDNWEYKSLKAKEPNSEIEKDMSLNGSGGACGASQYNQNQHRNRTFSGRLIDRVLEHSDRRFQYDTKRSVDRQGASNRRVSNKESSSRGKRANSYHIYEEPEWFSAGPTSQLETIDLHGFDDLENNEESFDTEDRNEEFPQLDTKLVAQRNNDVVSRRSSNVSLSLSDANPSNDIKDTGENILNFIQNTSEMSKHNKNQPSQLQYSQTSESEFNFDAFLNMHPLDNSLMSNDGIEKNETKATSRFSRWFRHKEPETLSLGDLHTQEKLGIPSVKELEAQMTKMDIKTDSVSPVAGPFPQIVEAEKPISRDTEAFKKLLQQLGSQTKQPHSGNDVYHTNTIHDQIESNHSHKVNDCHPQQPALNAYVPNIPSNNHVHTQNRMEIEHLIQRLVCGDVSLDFLEKELSNPSTPVTAKEVISTVLREYSHSKKNLMAMGELNIFNPSALQAQQIQQRYSEDLLPQNTSNHTINQLMAHGTSPPPLAFTPTSVLRKMTADKEATQTLCSSHSLQTPYLNSQHVKQISTHKNVHESQPTATMAAQPRMILGGGNFAIGLNNQMPQCRNQQVLKWATGNMHVVQGKSFGRPILKGSLNSLPQQNSTVPFSSHKIEMPTVHQQQQMQPPHQLRFKSTQSVESALSTENVHQNMSSPVGWYQLFLQHQQNQIRQQPRHRLIYGDVHRQSNIQMSSPAPNFSDNSDPGNMIKNNSITTSAYHRDERIQSPTNNQLAQWFSPELLAKASAGKLPLLNMNQALSLEEFERSIQHSSAVVHN